MKNTNQDKYKFNVFTLLFDDKEIENQYNKFKFDESLQISRHGMIAAVLVHVLFLFLDKIMLTDPYYYWLIRIVILIPEIIALYIFSYQANYFKYYRLLLFFTILLNGIAMQIGLLLYGAETIFYWIPGTVVVILFGLVILKFDYFNASIVSLIIIVLSFIAIIHVHPLLTKAIYAFTILIISLLLLVIGAYNNERVSRKFYIKSQILLENEKMQLHNEKLRLSWLENMSNYFKHEIKNSLIGTQTSIELLRRHYSVANDDKYLIRVNKTLKAILWHLNKVSNATSLEKSLYEEQTEIIELDKCVEEHCSSYASVYPRQKINLLKKASDIKIYGSTYRICQLLDKLVSNAVDFTESGMPIDIVIDKTSQLAVLQVINHGAPLPEKTEQFFDLFFSSRKSEKQNDNMGLGLYVVKLITHQLGGEVMALNRKDASGAIFEVRLPLAS